MKKLLRYLSIGAISLIPLIVVIQLFLWFEELLLEYFRKIFFFTNGNYIIMASALVAVILTITFIGFSLEKYGKSIFITMIENLMQKIPLFKSIYNFTNDLLKMLFGAKGAQVFREVVLVPFPNTNLHSIGFVTSKLSEDQYIVFVPTCPNPTSGFTMLIKKEEICFVNISIEDAMKMVISVGAVVPTGLKNELLCLKKRED